LLAAQAAWAVPVGNFVDVVLYGGGFTQWDVDRNSSCESGTAYTPVSDGEIDDSITEQNDAYDGGLILTVGAEDFDDPNEVGNLSGQSLSVGPATLEGLVVSRTDAALGSSPTLRSLIRLRNTGGPKTRDIVWSSDLGSDGAEEVRDSSNGNTIYQLGDRWVISSDDDTTPGDPVLTHVLFGRSNPREKVVEIIDAPDGTGCFTVRFRVRVPRNGTRYLLFFTEMNRTNGGAETRAGKYNDPNLGPKLLKGIGPSVRNRILNWDL
jgi:hypothetical protein